VKTNLLKSEKEKKHKKFWQSISGKNKVKVTSCGNVVFRASLRNPENKRGMGELVENRRTLKGGRKRMNTVTHKKKHKGPFLERGQLLDSRERIREKRADQKSRTEASLGNVPNP